MQGQSRSVPPGRNLSPVFLAPDGLTRHSAVAIVGSFARMRSRLKTKGKRKKRKGKGDGELMRVWLFAFFLFPFAFGRGEGGPVGMEADDILVIEDDGDARWAL